MALVTNLLRAFACSTAAAIEWDEEFKKLANSVGGDNSGRAVCGVHESAYEDVETVKDTFFRASFNLAPFLAL